MRAKLCERAREVLLHAGEKNGKKSGSGVGLGRGTFRCIYHGSYEKDGDVV